LKFPGDVNALSQRLQTPFFVRFPRSSNGVADFPIAGGPAGPNDFLIARFTRLENESVAMMPLAINKMDCIVTGFRHFSFSPV
jgi:hypothetical protein